VTFSVAVSERKKDGRQEAQWYSVSIFGQKAEAVAPYLTKGKLVFVEGRLNLREYKDRDGNTRISADENASEVKVVGPLSPEE
jgi:single-strand DNA-binding protein